MSRDAVTSPRRLPLLTRGGWIVLGGLVMVAVYLYLDAPAPGCETITGTVTHVYSTFPRYSSNRVICRIRLPHDFYIEEHCRSPHVGTYVYVCKT